MSDLIDRQVAIDALDKSFPVDPMRNDYTQGIACGVALAMEYIKQLPSAQPEPTVTGKFPVITLDTVFKNEASNINMASYDRDVVGITIPTKPLEGFVRLSPPSIIEPSCADGCIYGWGSDECEKCRFKCEPKTGQWIPLRKEGCYKCSECLAASRVDYAGIPSLYWNYCPRCGAKMEEHDEID